MTVQLGDVVAVDFESLAGIDDVIGSYKVALTGPAPLSDADALDDLLELFEALAALMAVFLAARTTFERIRAINFTQDADLGFASFATTTEGDVTGNSVPPQACFGVSFGTDRIGSFGRKFWGTGAVSSLQSNGNWSGAALANVATAAAFMLDEFEATNGDWRFGIVSTIDDGFLPLQSASVSTTPTTQRRRRQGVGS